MRAMLMIGLVGLVGFGLTGCGNNQAKAEQAMQQIIDEMNNLATAVENGDKAAREASVAKLRQIAQANKNLKITKDQEKALEAKLKPQMDQVQKRMEAAAKSAIENKKMTPEEVVQFGQEMVKFGEEMKAMSK